MAILKLITGIPGSGKTTFIKNNIKENEKHISRDEVRFSMLGDADEYFSKETEVFHEWIWLIQKNLNAGFDVWADATHLSKGSRNKTLSHLKLENIDIEVYNIIAPLELCLERNSKRKGRAYVPERVIEDMSRTYVPATLHENYRFKTVTFIKGE